LPKPYLKGVVKKAFKRLKGLLPQIGIGVSLLMLVHSLWQLDLICKAPVWDTWGFINWFVGSGLPNYADAFFQCGFPFQTNVGIAYDYYLSLCVVSWFLLLISMWFYHWREIKIYKEQIKDLNNILKEE